MKNINWRVRFNKDNKVFILRLVAAIIIPVLAYLGLEATDLTSWGIVGQVLIDFFTNPYLIAITVFNIINLIPDPTTSGIKDSKQALTYDKPRKDDK